MSKECIENKKHLKACKSCRKQLRKLLMQTLERGECMGIAKAVKKLWGLIEKCKR